MFDSKCTERRFNRETVNSVSTVGGGTSIKERTLVHAAGSTWRCLAMLRCCTTLSGGFPVSGLFPVNGEVFPSYTVNLKSPAIVPRACLCLCCVLARSVLSSSEYGEILGKSEKSCFAYLHKSPNAAEPKVRLVQKLRPTAFRTTYPVLSQRSPTRMRRNLDFFILLFSLNDQTLISGKKRRQIFIELHNSSSSVMSFVEYGVFGVEEMKSKTLWVPPGNP